MSIPPKANRKPVPAAIRAATRRAPAAPTPLSDEPPKSENRAQLHKDRAKRWGAPSPWAAEWFENAVRYCQTPEGRQRYETWLKSRTPPGEVTSILKAIAEPPIKQSGPGRGNLKMWNNAAYELGVSDEALKQFHSFTATNNLVAPERTLPPVRRRRGESAAEYLTRRHDSLLQGCKIPDIDWKDIRKIAIAQYDATRDTYEMWHKDMEFYIDVLRTRASTTVAIDRAINKALSGPTPELDMEIQLRTDAYRSTQLLIHIGHVFWRRASEVLDELDRKGLVTSSAIERAYLKDSRLKWRLVSVRELGVLYRAKCGARLETVFARLPAFRNYIKSYRTADGQLHLELNHAYIRNHPWKGDNVDELVTYMCAKSTGSFYMYFRELNNLLHKYPKEAEKFTSNAWDEIGIMSDICEFTTAFVESPFAQNLLNHASKELTSEEEKLMMEELCFMNPGMLKEDTTKYNVSYQQRSGRAERITLDMISTWSNEIYDAKMTPGNFMGITTVRDQSGSKHELFRGMTEEQMRVLIIPMFDEMWLMTDGMLWEKAKRLDPPGKKGFVAKMFGLYDPSKPRTFYIEIFMEEIKAARKAKENQGDQAKENAAGVVKTGYQSPFPVAGPLDSAGRSGHAYVTAKGGDSKEKVKTRGEANNSDATANVDEEEEEELPDVLPTEFKLPKKVWKLFNRLLEDDTKTDTDASQKKGQVRWGEFEKGMKRIGFDVVQTAGSSVRFDPPARNGRPITFHRPHPDSLLTPHLIKWVGARLKRTYGWTTETFQRKEGDSTTELD